MSEETLSLRDRLISWFQVSRLILASDTPKQWRSPFTYQWLHWAFRTLPHLQLQSWLKSTKRSLRYARYNLVKFLSNLWIIVLLREKRSHFLWKVQEMST